MFQISIPHTLQLLCVTTILSSLGGYENIELLNVLPQRLIEYLQVNFALAKRIQNEQFHRKIKNYSENPSYPSLNSLLCLINRLSTWRESFGVELSFAQIFELIPPEVRPKHSPPAYIYRYCLRCAFFQLRYKTNYHYQVRHKYWEGILPAHSLRYEILIALICQNCFNLLFDHAICVDPEPWMDLSIDRPLG